MQEELYIRLVKELENQLPWSSKAQTKNLALLTQGLVFGRKCSIGNLVSEYPLEGRRESLENRLRRFLSNSQVGWKRHYSPLVSNLLSGWTDKEINLVMDRTDMGQERSILMLGLAFKHRTIPLNWRVLEFGGTGEEIQKKLLGEVAGYIPKGKRVMFYGDSEFRAVGLQIYCREKGWGWQVGVKSDTLFRTENEEWKPLKTLMVEKGKRRYVHNLTLTKSSSLKNVHLIVDWTHDWKTPRYIICHQETGSRSWRRGRKRYWIEPTFRDWKSYGFDLEASHMTSFERFERLLLGMSTATLWLLCLGHWLENTGRHTWLTATHRRDYSLFRLGRDYAQRSLVRGWELPIRFQP